MNTGTDTDNRCEAMYAVALVPAMQCTRKATHRTEDDELYCCHHFEQSEKDDDFTPPGANEVPF